jgi:uncharacterized cofD-like protein
MENGGKPKVAVIGGGSGTFVVLSGLKEYPLALTAIITVADSGGSTGRLRDQFGFLPVGDLRQSLASLARESDQTWIRDLLLYRFSHGDGLEGHNLGNLILTALQDMTGSTPKALEVAGKVFRLSGTIYPITTQNVDLVIEYTDGTFIIGEHKLNPENVGGKKIKRIRLSPHAQIYSKAQRTIINSDHIVIGPGDLYASILPNFAVGGVKGAFRQSKAKIIYIVNLMTRYTQTHGYTASDHVEEIRNYIGRYPDIVIVNNKAIPKNILKNYEQEQGYPVINDLTEENYKVVSAPLWDVAKNAQKSSDNIKRNYLIHDRKSLTDILLDLING